MKRSRFSQLVVAFMLLLRTGGAYSQPDIAADSALSLERIEAAIAFLDDSQNIAVLKGRLQLLVDAQRAVSERSGVDSLPVKAAATFNLFRAVQKVSSDFVVLSNELIRELHRFSTQAGTIRNAMERSDFRERLLTLIILIIAAFSIGLLFGFGIWRIGRRLRNAAFIDREAPKRFIGIFAIILTRSSFGVGGATALFLVSFFPVGPVPQHFFSVAGRAYLLYIAAITLLYVLFSPNISRLRTIACSDTAALMITRRCSTIFRVSLLMYFLHQATGMLELTYAKLLVSRAFQVVMTLLIPYTLWRLRQLYLEPFQRFRDERVRHRRLFLILDFILAKVPLIVMLYMIVLTGLSIAGPASTYRFFIQGTIKTLIVLLAGGFLLALWSKVMKMLGNAQRSVLSQYQDLQERIAGNMKTIGRVGYGGIYLTALILLVMTWGLRIGHLLTSKTPVVQLSLRIAAILVGAWAVLQISCFLISRFKHAAQKRMLSAGDAKPIEIEKRVTTLGAIVQKMVTVSIFVIGVIMVMDELGFDVKAMLAGVGIVGVAVGFGAQNLVRDVISGLFVIFENRIRVGDVAIINGTGGLVEQVNLRTSVLRGLDGTVHVFPNGAVTTLSNMTHDFSYYVFDLGVAYKEDTDHVSEVLKRIGEELRNDPEFGDAVLEPLEILGVDAFADSAVIIKARIKTLPIKQWSVGREMNRRIKKRFDELGIEIPFPHQTLYFGAASKPFAVRMADAPLQGEERKEPAKKVSGEQQAKG
ncbi:MAG: mechanosensitive ion channel family protein [Chitinispirillaceae bacterium]|nr:mechanosensitive ion channel family protein [Chitinispirillaceae bacterium]